MRKRPSRTALFGFFMKPGEVESFKDYSAAPGRILLLSIYLANLLLKYYLPKG